MIRKSGYQDKAVAIETIYPPVVQLIETGTAAEGADGDEEKAAAARRAAARRHAIIKKHKDADSAPVDSAPPSDER